MPPNNRRRARTLAFQTVFMLDAQAVWELKPVREFLARIAPPPSQEARDYAVHLAALVIEHRDTIDAWLNRAHPRWQLKRMRAEDRNLLRCGTAELWYCPQVPPKAALNEWIEIAKVFGGDDSPRFVNGILDRAAKDKGPTPAL